jgi:DNA-binding CsgD family transcriptional regulator
MRASAGYLEHGLRMSAHSGLTGEGLEGRVKLLDTQLKGLRGDLRSRWRGGEGRAWMAVIEEMEHRLGDLSFYIDCRECVLPDRPRAQSTSQVDKTHKDMLRMAAQGMTNAEIATRLELSVSAVSARFVAMYRHMGVRSRGQAIAKAIGAGWIDIDS